MSHTNVDAEPLVLVVYTGGTIGMLRDGSSYVPYRGFLEASLRSQSRFHDPHERSVLARATSVAAFASAIATPEPVSTPPLLPVTTVQTGEGPQALDILITPRSALGKRVRYVILEYENLIDSSEIRPSDWIRIASDIERNYHAFDSFVVLHGTDTMAYTACALSFLLEGLGKSVILTGAQIPLSELRNDAVENLLGALIIAGHFVIPEVTLFFNSKLFRGNRTIKRSTSELNAFDSPNLAPLAAVSTDIAVNWDQVLRPSPVPFRAHKKLSASVSCLRLFPGMSPAVISDIFSAEGLKGVVLQSYGAGNAPTAPKFLNLFRDATRKGIIIVNISQCDNGIVSDTYETGRALSEAGVLNGSDMTVEAALTKLSYLLSEESYTPEQVRRLISLPLRGELTLATPVPHFTSPFNRLEQLWVMANLVSDPTVSTSAFETSKTDLPLEMRPTWPATANEARKAESAMLPFILTRAVGEKTHALETTLKWITANAGDFALSRSDFDTPQGNKPPLEKSQTATLTQGDALLSTINRPYGPEERTLLHLAVLAGIRENVQLLIEYGANVHARDARSHTPLFYAARHDADYGIDVGLPTSLVSILQESGAHFSRVEVEKGDVGFEIVRARGISKHASSVWKRAFSDEEGLSTAMESFIAVAATAGDV